MKDRERIKNLFQKYFERKCTPDELRELFRYFKIPGNERLLKDLIENHLRENDDEPVGENSILLDHAFTEIQQAIRAHNYPVAPVLKPVYTRFWFRLSAAVIFLFFLSSVGYLSLQRKNNPVSAGLRQQDKPAQDIPPGTHSAILTLDDGAAILLDSAANGTLARQGNVNVLKNDGDIMYSPVRSEPADIQLVYNTISTLKGNEYHLVLSDGTQVWLNAASSIRFPASFAGNERRVEITGEVYFEVARMHSKPFYVNIKTGNSEPGEVEVLGTHFNINSYADEEEVKTTLLEGSVKIKRSNEIKTLSPGEQAKYDSKTMVIEKNVDVGEVIAWKEGLFHFNNTGIKAIMRQMARWYDVEVDFEGKVPDEGFTGTISKRVPLSVFLKIMELNGIHLKADGKKVIVMP